MTKTTDTNRNTRGNSNKEDRSKFKPCLSIYYRPSPTVHRLPFTVHRLIFLCLFLFLPIVFVAAQSREDLTKKRQRLLAEIEKAAKLLSSTKQDKAIALDQYYTVQRQVKQRRQLIGTLNEEIDLSTESIERTSMAIEALLDDTNRLEKEYGEMLRKAYRSKMNDNRLLFLFSAEGLSDGLKRWRYLQQYDEYRKKQAGLISETRASLADKLAGMKIKKTEQEELLIIAEQQEELLAEELKLSNQILRGLVANETRISKLINKKRKAHRQLSKAIENIISAEISSRTSTDSGKNSSDKSKSSKSTTAATRSKKTENITKDTGEFKNQKGKLSWPVKKGLITRHFGKQAHPIHKKVMITNNGIDIKTVINNKVLAIFQGLVAGVQYVPGYQNTLIIQHGNYYSVYSNLEKVNVKKGDFLKTGQFLGVAGKSSQNNYLEVHLEIWKGKQRLNPAVWLSK